MTLLTGEAFIKLVNPVVSIYLYKIYKTQETSKSSLKGHTLTIGTLMEAVNLDDIVHAHRMINYGR
jgi:hypothetical protein